MKEKIKTSIAYTKNILVTGAMSQTTRKVELEVTTHVNPDKPQTIVEYGMGHGNITREILRQMSSDSRLITFEVNKDFCDKVKAEIDDPRLRIINDSAENVKHHISEQLDLVIASIPFSFFSKEKSLGIITDSYDLLENRSYYSQALYTKFNFKKFEQVFDNCELIRLSVIPSEFIYHCQKLRN